MAHNWTETLHSAHHSETAHPWFMLAAMSSPSLLPLQDCRRHRVKVMLKNNLKCEHIVQVYYTTTLTYEKWVSDVQLL
jgi:hypothetical protein